MSKKPHSLWLSGLAINLISNLIAFIVGGFTTYFSHEGSAWIKPLLFGGIAWLVTFCSILAIRYMNRLPRRLDPLTVENAGRRIRDWLDEFNLTVKSVPDSDCDFFYIVTTDGGKKISIFRNLKQNTDYISLKGLITTSDDEKAIIARMSDDEKISLRLALELELSRAVMGYTTQNMLDSLTIFKRVPITETLSAEDLLTVMWEVEAMLTSLFVIGALGFHRHSLRQKEEA